MFSPSNNSYLYSTSQYPKHFYAHYFKGASPPLIGLSMIQIRTLSSERSNDYHKDAQPILGRSRIDVKILTCVNQLFPE